jgi:baculoviral IAP repeat-containing protein 6
MNPNDIIPEFSPDLPQLFVTLVEESCFLQVLRNYLLNDSVLDITRHIPLYRTILQLLRALATSTQMIHLLSDEQENDPKTTVASRFEQLKTCLELYADKLK